MAEPVGELTPEQIQQEREKARNELWGDGDVITEGADEDQLVKEAEEKSAEEKAEDPWAGLNPALRQEFETLKAKASELGTVFDRLKQAERRIGSITNELGQAKKAAEDAAKAKGEGEAPTKEQIDAAAISDEQWKALKEDFPEWADAIEKRLSTERARIDKEFEVTKTLALNKSGVSDEKIQEIEVKFSKKLVSIKHPKWEETVKTEDFKNWIFAQSDQLKNKCGSMDSEDAIEVLDLFVGRKKGGGPKTAAQIVQERKDRLRKSEVDSHGRVRQPEKTDDELTPAELRHKIAQEVWAT